MNTSVKTKCQELDRQHFLLLNRKLGGEQPALLVEEAQSLLQKLRVVGRLLSDTRQRLPFEAYAAYWGAFIFEQTGTYPNTALDPVEEKLVESLHGDDSRGQNFQQLHDQHIALLDKKFGPEPPQSLDEEAQCLLQEIRDAGRYIGNQSERRRLRSYAVYWGAFIYEHTKVYPNTALYPASVKVYKTQTPFTVPFLAPQLPSYNLVGRDDLLKQLKGQLLAGKSIIALHGLPGVGKTALAVALAHDPQVQAHFSDGVLWAGLGHLPSLTALLEQWGLTLGLTSDQIAKQTTLKERGSFLRVAIGSKKMLLVVDDAWQPEAALAFGVGGINCAFLVTTRQPLIGLALAGESCPVRELVNEEGLALLKQLAPKAVAAEPEAAKELVAAVSGLPLALVLMGWELRKASHSTQPRRLRAAYARLALPSQRLQLSAPQVPAGHYPNLSANTPLSLPAVIAKHTLARAARYTLSALSLLPAKPNTFSEEAALAVAGEPVETLDTLVDAGLLESSGAGRYTLHPTIANVARENGPEAQQTSEAEAKMRMIDFFLALTEQKNGDTFSQEANNIQAALEMAQEGGAR